MNVFLDEIKSKFAGLEKREQTALISLSTFLFVTFLYLGVWAPLDAYQVSAQQDYKRHLALFEYLKSTEAEAKNAVNSGSATSPGGQSLLTIVSRTAQGVGISPSRMQPEGDDAVSVWFDAVAFSPLMLWLERLESTQGIVVRQITLDRKDQAGQVSARLILRN